VLGGTLEVSFLEYEHGRRPSTKKFYPEPHHPRVSLDVQKDFGENERNKDNQHGVELALLDFARQPLDPTHLMINRWCCEQHRIREILVRVVTSPCLLSL
jgi:hypothetical protein